MTRRTRIVQVLAIAALLLFNGSSFAAEKNGGPTLIVQFKQGASLGQLKHRYDFDVVRGAKEETGENHTFIIKASGNGSLTTLKNRLSTDVDVEWVEENKTVKVVPLDDGGETVLPLDGGETVLPLDDGGETVLPLDGIVKAYEKVAGLVVGSPGFILQPAFAKIAWYGAVLKNTGRGVTIADLDTGADTCHVALRGIYVVNFVDDEPRAPEDCPVAGTVPGPGYGHGTAVASLLHVLAPEANVWMLRIFDSTGEADVLTVYEAVVWAANHGVKVINMSFGATENSYALRAAVAYAQRRGVVMAGAGGNSNLDAIMYPAGISPTIGTASTDVSDQKSSFSNYNTAMSASAPGNRIVVAYPDNRWAIAHGTSFASPMVAADAALVTSAWMTRSSYTYADYVRGAVVTGVDNIYPVNPQYTGKLGSGRINMYKAIRKVAP